VISDGARDSACRGTSGDCSGQGANRANGGAHAGYDEGRADRRVGARDGNGASGCDGTHGALTAGDSGSMKGGDGCSQGDRSDTDGG
jgi:hypothetical protein